MNSGLDPQNARRLPTRVSKACLRCRRHKSRCDTYRPCSLCLRANAACEPSPSDGHTTDKFTRNRPRNSSQQQRAYPQRRPRRESGRDTARPGYPHPAGSSIAENEIQPATPRSHPSQYDSSAHVDYDGSESVMGIARKIYRLDGHDINEYSTSAIPDGGPEPYASRPTAGEERRSISQILHSRFPDKAQIYSLLDDYFQTVHWFSLVIYEPKFRQQLLTIEDGSAYPTDEPFLVLLSMVMSMAAWYRHQKAGLDSGEVWRLWSGDLLRIVESRLMVLMDQRSISAVQTCTLLGSHHVYHGRPNLSFALLGAVIKMSHAMGLHRDTKCGSAGEIEERKRVWWTIYTWDRFASISYGRPLSINDEECNVAMPASFLESPYFTQDSISLGLSGVLYSSYQVQLSSLYLIAAPALREIFGSLLVGSTNKCFEPGYTSLVKQVTRKLIAWRRALPHHLSLDLDQDYSCADADWSSRAHVLQSLSLQLTFDNLLIVLHRPFLSHQVEHLSTDAFKTCGNPSDLGGNQRQSQVAYSLGGSESPEGGLGRSPECWWEAAVRTARVTELPQLAQAATDSHLFAFMAMNLFHAATVLIVVALTDPLSDAAQGVKRTVTRIFRLEDNLSQHSVLSTQSSRILKDLISLLLQREKEAILGHEPSEPAAQDAQADQSPVAAERPHISLIQDAPDPTQYGISYPGSQTTLGQAFQNSSLTQRLNESLATVQRIIPSSQNNLPQTYDTAGSRGQDEPQACEFISADTDRAQAGYYSGNDIFWLWDLDWDEYSAL